MIRLAVLLAFIAAALLLPVPTVDDLQQYFTNTRWVPPFMSWAALC
ncbi:hypothetical protein ACVWY0_001668 [Arthrobacter sp. UYNi723]